MAILLLFFFIGFIVDVVLVRESFFVSLIYLVGLCTVEECSWSQCSAHSGTSLGP